MRRLGLGCVLLAAVAAPAGAASPDPKDLAIPAADRARAADLVRLLGSDEYRTREQAERELTGMGRRARPALLAAGSDPSPEVRGRAGRLLPKAEAADRKARLDTFEADADGKYEHDLPGWAAFRNHVGADRAARRLYADVARSAANLDLLEAAGGPPEAGGRAVADRRVGLYLQTYPQVAVRFGGAGGGTQGRAQPPTVPDLSALLLAEAVVPGQDVPRSVPFPHVTAGTFLSTTAAAVALNSPDAKHGPAFRRLVAGWLDTRTSADQLTAAVSVAQGLNQFDEQVLPLFRRAVTNPGVEGWGRGTAIGFLVGRQGASAAPFLKSLLADESPVTTVWLGNNPNNPQGAPLQVPCLLKDVALGVLVLQAGKDLKAFEFDTTPGQAVTALAALGQGSITFAFVSDERRAAGFKKWAEWEAAGKAPARPPAELAPPPRAK